MIFVFQFVKMVYHIYLHIEEYLHLWDKANLFMMYDPLRVLLNSVTRILLRTSASMFISDFGL